MKFRQLSTKWKILIIVLSVISVLLISLIIGYSFVLSSYRQANENARSQLIKSDSELIGQRITIERNGKPNVDANIYVPNDNIESLPLLFNIHGGGFVGGDADVLDTQSARLSSEGNIIVVSINYTKADVKPIGYGSREIADSIEYFYNNAEDYNIDKDKISIVGYSAGAYYAAQATQNVIEDGYNINKLIMAYPWSTGLETDMLIDNWPETLFILGGNDPISQNSKPYIEAQNESGGNIEVIEYDDAVHSFIESNNPEGVENATEDMSEIINDKQKELARDAEDQILKFIK